MNKYQEALDKLTPNDRDIVHHKDGWWSGQIQAVTLIQELVDKATPRKPNISKIIRSVSNFTAEYENQAFCPNCNTRLNIKGMCCPNNDCRQKIDWSKDDNHHR